MTLGGYKYILAASMLITLQSVESETFWPQRTEHRWAETSRPPLVRRPGQLEVVPRLQSTGLSQLACPYPAQPAAR